MRRFSVINDPKTTKVMKYRGAPSLPQHSPISQSTFESQSLVFMQSYMIAFHASPVTVRIRLLVEVLAKLHLPEYVHPQHPVHEHQQEQQSADVYETREAHHERVEQHPESFQRANQPEHAREAEQSEHRRDPAAADDVSDDRRAHAEKIEAVPPVVEIRLGVHRVQLRDRLEEEDAEEEVPEPFEHARRRIRLTVRLSGHRDRVRHDRGHYEPLEIFRLDDFVHRRALFRLRVVVQLHRRRGALILLLAPDPLLLRFRHETASAVRARARELREVIENDADEQVQDEKIRHDHERHEIQRRRRVIVSLRRHLVRPRVDAVVHHRRPPLRGAHLEQRLHRVPDVVKVPRVRRRGPNSRRPRRRGIGPRARRLRRDRRVVARPRDRAPLAVGRRRLVPVDALGSVRDVRVAATRERAHEERHAEDAEDEPE
eukprot:31494-Pelagococcus_subviridis.AAC.20